MSYPTGSESLTVGTHTSAGTTRQRQENRGWLTRRRGNGETHRWPQLRRGQWHRRVPSDDTHLPIPFPQLLPLSSYDCVGNGGRRRGRCGTPATASPHCPGQAQYELHGVMVTLTKKRKEKGDAPIAPATVSSNCGEVEARRPRARRMRYRHSTIGSTRGRNRYRR